MPKSFLVKNRLGVRVSESEHIFIRKGQAMSKGDIADMTLGIQYENHGDHGLKSWATFISKQQYAATTSRDSSPSEPQIRSFKGQPVNNIPVLCMRPLYSLFNKNHVLLKRQI